MPIWIMTISDHSLLSYCNTSHACMLYTRSGSPHNVLHLPSWKVIGASLSEPHASESNSAIVSILLSSLWYVRLTESKYKILILRIIVVLMRSALRHYICGTIRAEATGSLQAQ